MLPGASRPWFPKLPGKAANNGLADNERKIPHRRWQQHGGAGTDFSPPQMTQPSSLSGKLILQQPFKWPPHPQLLPRPSAHPMLPHSSSHLLALQESLQHQTLHRLPRTRGTTRRAPAWDSKPLISGPTALLSVPWASWEEGQRCDVPTPTLCVLVSKPFHMTSFLLPEPWQS